MNRKNHIIVGFFVWIIAILMVFFLIGMTFEDSAMWVILSFFVCQFGTQLPDYDLLTRKYLIHRNFFTHSVILPALLSIPIYFVQNETNVLLPLFAFFLFGYSSHLFFDLKPKSWQGSARIHFWWRNMKGFKQMGSKRSFVWVLINAIMLLAAGVIILFFFNVWV